MWHRSGAEVGRNEVGLDAGGGMNWEKGLTKRATNYKEWFCEKICNIT